MASRASKVTINDIARKASVSPGTVDRVIHNREGVSETTRKMILRHLKKMDYQPDVLASNLSSKKHFKISAIYPGLNSGRKFWSLPEKGMQQAIKELSHFKIEFQGVPFDQHSISSFKSSAEKLIKSRPDGVIIAPVFHKETSELVGKLKAAKIDLVFMNSCIKNIDYLSYIGQDSKASAEVAARLMYECLGKEDKIAVLSIGQDPHSLLHIGERERGFLEYTIKNSWKSATRISSFTIENRSEAKNMESFKEIFNSNEFKGVFITNSRAYKLAAWLQQNKKYRPLVIGYDLIPENRNFLKLGLLSFLISQKPEEQGYKSIMTLFNHHVLKRKIVKNNYLAIDIITSENLPYYSSVL